MKINKIIPVKYINSPQKVGSSGYITCIIATDLELTKDTEVNTVYSFSNLEEVKAKINDTTADSSKDVLAAAELYFLNGGGKLKIFVADSGESGANLSDPAGFITALLATREYFKLCMFTHSNAGVNSVITKNNVAQLAAALKIEGIMFSHTVNENEYDDFKAALSLDFAHLACSTIATQTFNLKNKYLYLASAAKFGTINRASKRDSTIKIQFQDPVGLNKNLDISTEFLNKLENDKTMHVDNTQVGGRETSVFFVGNMQTDGETLTEVLVNNIALSEDLQADGLSLLRNNVDPLKYNVIGFGKVINSARNTLISYSGAEGIGNGSLSPLSVEQIDADDSLLALDEEQKGDLLKYGFAIKTKAESFDPTDAEIADQKYPEIAMLINPSFGASIISYSIAIR